MDYWDVIARNAREVGWIIFQDEGSLYILTWPRRKDN